MEYNEEELRKIGIIGEADEVVKDENLTIEYLSKRIVSKMNYSNWITDANYNYRNFSLRKGRDADLLLTKGFYPLFNYLTTGLRNISDWKKNDSLIGKELLQYDKEGSLCLYASVLGSILAYERLGYSKESISLYQGYYKFDADPTIPFSSVFGAIQLGTHSWFEINDIILDFSIITQEDVTRLPFAEGIIGYASDRIELIGVEESFETIKKYCRRFAKAQGMTYYDWLRQHTIDMMKEYL